MLRSSRNGLYQPYADQFQHPHRQKQLRQDIALPEPARFHEKAEEPFEAGAPHPFRSLANTSGMKIECGADAEHHDTGQSVAMIGHPALLLGAADADE